MLIKTAATAVAITFALAFPADALGLGGLGGGLGGRGKGKSTSSGSSASSSAGSSRSGGVSAGASAGRGGISAGARAGGIGVGASVGRSGASVSSSIGSAASVGASVSRSGVSTNTSVGGVSVGTSVSRTGVSATVGGLNASSPSAAQQPQAETVQALAAVGPAALLLLPLPSALQPSGNRTCAQENGCRAAPNLMEGRASVSGSAPAKSFGNASSDSDERLSQKPGTPASIVSACQLAAVRAAQAYGAVSVEAVSAGKFAATSSGGGVAPVNLRVNYPGATGSRQARVSCAVNSDGVVTGLAV